MAASDKTSDGGRQDLEDLRKAIDGIDEQIVSLLAERQREVKRVTEIKKARNLPVYHPSREEDLISNRRSQGSAAGLDPDFIEEVYRIILRQARVEQA